jgi:YHS domain-containing protein
MGNLIVVTRRYAVSTLRDPVCGAEVTASSAVAIESHGPLALYFCSERCHEAYLADPARYVSHDAGAEVQVFTNEDVSVQPQPWRDDGDLEGPPTKRPPES